ncbi:MAG: histidinol dehydrogenase [Anaerolineales bacterium]|nr:histidinol dehydrogenase [Anaerolineales bacterium]MCS7248763.1 histidinol dehydrogenase [Anaerolineales bacterium]MDW8162576.1 histidinol dehydrogenase [Anaerolineales bacterium]MDW8447457.1 histidinol dehydrogenase [Anaerolineales bacterium]
MTPRKLYDRLSPSIMLPIYDLATAKQSILLRTPLAQQEVPSEILARIEALFGERLTPAQAVHRILEDVRLRGDKALRHWTERLDGITLDTFRIPPQELRQALDKLPERTIEALREGARRIEAFHLRQPLHSWLIQGNEGTLGQLVRPIERVGVYVPGGTAPLPSTVLMTVIPARVAGVAQIALATPPDRRTGKVSPVTLAAAAIAGADEVYTIGGAQAIAALAYGTESIPAVDKIVGPGNLFVTLAKQQVYGIVGIDGLAGPTETMILADETANPEWVAADLLAQAEHDPLASAILLTPSSKLATAVQRQVALQLEGDHRFPALSREQILAISLKHRSGIVLVENLEQACQIVNQFAPEHLALCVANPWQWVEKIHSAGAIFIGEHSFEVLGDYIAGPSHVLPTGGTARFASSLSCLDFVRVIGLVALAPEVSRQLSPLAAEIAYQEGLDAHAQAALRRLNDSLTSPSDSG